MGGDAAMVEFKHNSTVEFRVDGRGGIEILDGEESLERWMRGSKLKAKELARYHWTVVSGWIVDRGSTVPPFILH